MPQQSRAQRRRQPVRSAQSVARQQPQQRRLVRAVEPIDYSRDYEAVRHDLRRIALWAALLFVAMAALYFVL
ncbi:MAG: hypothetical protein H7Y32_12410 [Chloroflexales bacterium]|nr:hypothetical protein [Chloroflexales bacterium]